MDLENLKEDVRRKLSELCTDALGELCGELELTIPDGKEGKKSLVYNLIAMHLMSKESDEADEGRAAFEAVSGVLDRILEEKAKRSAEKRKEVKKEVSDGGGSMSGVNGTVVAESEQKAKNKGPVLASGAGSSQGSHSSERVTVQLNKIREFKITGGVVGGEENAVDMTDLQFQMDEGKDLGYTAREIRAGVIKAMKAGSHTRRYFERNVNVWDQDEFMEMLQLVYTKKESSQLLDTMAESVQGPAEEEKKYVLRMFELRDNIMEVTATEDEPLAQTFVQKKMIRAISVGLRRM